MFQWYRELNAAERKAFHACFVGWATDALDTQLFSFLIPTLVALWAITNSEAGWLGTSALISSSLGGWIAGIMCDRIGRVTVMKIAIAWVHHLHDRERLCQLLRTIACSPHPFRHRLWW